MYLQVHSWYRTKYESLQVMFHLSLLYFKGSGQLATPKWLKWKMCPLITDYSRRQVQPCTFWINMESSSPFGKQLRHWHLQISRHQDSQKLLLFFIIIPLLAINKHKLLHVWGLHNKTQIPFCQHIIKRPKKSLSTSLAPWTHSFDNLHHQCKTLIIQVNLCNFIVLICSTLL